MIKGIYNENEFYTNFYWDSKFIDDLRLKVGDSTSTQSSISALKGLDSQFWALMEVGDGHEKRIATLAEFYKTMFQILGYSPECKVRQSSKGQSYSVIAATQSNSPELFAVLVEQTETGSFEQPPVLIQSHSRSEVEIVEGELADLIQEEFQDSQNPPRWILVGSPNALFIIERNKWSFGRFLRVEWQEIFLQRDSRPYEILFGIGARQVLCPESGKSPHDEFDDNSHRHAFEVTTELRESVREGVELLINEMIDLKKESHQKIYSTDTADQYARELSHDALYYVYRLLFLLYLEAQGEDSELLPLKSEIYRNGYSLEKLLELDYVEVAPDSVESKGTFLSDSLDQIFSLIYFGFEPAKEGIFQSDSALSGFLVKGIKSELFDPSTMKHLRGIKLRNGVLLDILKKLSLTRKRERGGKPRARVSYANLGINQLGAVYEGLLSYSGFFAKEDLHALKPAGVKQSDIDNGQELGQVYLAPRSLVEKYRKSPEKKHKLTDDNIVLDEFGNPKIYKKGSFIYRLAGRDRQKLASYYTPESLTKCNVKYSLKVLIEERKTLKDLWAVRILEPAMGSGAFLNEAVNQLADKILELEIQSNLGELKTPKAKQKRLSEIKYQLISNNVFGVDLNPTAVELARFSLWLNCIGAGKEPPKFDGRLKVGNSLIGARFRKTADGVYSWLLLHDGMMNYGKRLKDYDEDSADKISAFRADFLGTRFDPNQVKVRSISKKADALYSTLIASNSSQEAKIEASKRLRLCGDLWCSLFFLAAEDLPVAPSTHEKYLELCESIIENGSGILNSKISSVINRISERERFFHWEIEFSEVVQDGFDLILGNPPWVALEWKDGLVFSDSNCIPAVLGLSAPDTRKFIEKEADETSRRELASEYRRLIGYFSLLELWPYEDLKSLSKNTYKYFLYLGFLLVSPTGVVGLIQEDGLLEEGEAEAPRRKLYYRLRYHFQFQNELLLFAEVHDAKRYSIYVCGAHRDDVSFDHIGNLFLVSTLDQSYDDALVDLPVPAIKDEVDKWETRGHPKRRIQINRDVLELFRTMENASDPFRATFLNIHSEPLIGLVSKLARSERNVREFVKNDGAGGSVMLNEVNAQEDDLIAKGPWDHKVIETVVLSGPNIDNYLPFAQQTKRQYTSNQSYESVELSELLKGSLPRTLFKLGVEPGKIDRAFSDLEVAGTPYRKTYRLATKSWVNPANERSLFTCIVPPGVSHINGIVSLAISDLKKLAVSAGFLGTMVLDSVLRLKSQTHIYPDDILAFPMGTESKFDKSIARRALLLNSVTSHFDSLLKANEYLDDEDDDSALGQRLPKIGRGWSVNLPIADVGTRKAVGIEIEALVALAFGLTSEELVQCYQVMFPVVRKYDRKDGFVREELLRTAFKYFKERGW